MKLKRNIAISENGFVFDPTTGESFTVNPIGSEIIHALREQKTKEEMLHELLEKYDVEPAVLERHFYDFISTLREYNLIENEPANA